LATLKEQWAIAYHLPGATADFSPELTKQAQVRAALLTRNVKCLRFGSDLSVERGGCPPSPATRF
jgi:hypothetical protein